jgi:hypothetical protein
VAADVFFYELHEGDNEVYSEVLLVSESEWEPEEFFELVQRIRRDVQDIHEHDTLIEAIAVALERDHGFVFADEHLTAAVNVSTEEADNFLSDLEGDFDDADEDDDGDEDDERTETDYRTILADLDINGGSRPH